MTNVKAMVHLQTYLLFGWVPLLIERLVVKVVHWAFSKRSVQDAFVDCITCRTPIGLALNEQIEKVASELLRDELGSHRTDADDVHGLDRYIESGIDDYFSNSSIDVEDIKGFDRALDDAVTSALDEMETDQLARHIAQRLSY